MIRTDYVLNKWDKRYLDVAKLVGSWTSCYRHEVGAVIVKDNRIIATGYNGAPIGVKSCKEEGFCHKASKGVLKGPDHCRAAHAEQNALAQAARLGVAVKDATLYCTLKPCSICAKLMIQAGIKRVIYLGEYDEELTNYIQESQTETEFISCEDYDDNK